MNFPSPENCSASGDSVDPVKRFERYSGGQLSRHSGFSRYDHNVEESTIRRFISYYENTPHSRRRVPQGAFIPLLEAKSCLSTLLIGSSRWEEAIDINNELLAVPYEYEREATIRSQALAYLKTGRLDGLKMNQERYRSATDWNKWKIMCME